MNYYILTIRKSRVKEYTTTKELYHVLRMIDEPLHIWDTGIHIHGRYNQLHLHCYVSMSRKKPRYFRYTGYYIHWEQVRDGEYEEAHERIWHYIHSDDHGSAFKHKQNKVENFSRYHYMFT